MSLWFSVRGADGTVVRRIVSATTAATILGLTSFAPGALAQVDQDEIEETVIDVAALGIPDYDLNAETFDVVTTTDTEVGWMRLELETLEFSAILGDSAAASAVTAALGQRNEAAEEVKVAQLELEERQESLGAAAIDGFLGNVEGNLNDVLSPDLDAIASDSLAEFTTGEIVLDRDAARQRLDEAQAVLEEAEAALRLANSVKSDAEDLLNDASDARSRFDDRAAEHAQIADEADARAAALGSANAALGVDDGGAPDSGESIEAPAVRNSNVELRSVAGVFNVNIQIEDELDALIAHARADGIFMSGGAYRTIESQIALRLAHCGGITPPQAATSAGSEAAGAPAPSPSPTSNLTRAQGQDDASEPPVTQPPVTEAPVTEAPVTEAPVTEAPVTDAPLAEAPATETPGDGSPEIGGATDGTEATEGDGTEGEGTDSAAWRYYVIYEAPASSCSPPTAPPGRSQHQTGLAIDFTENASILTWSSPAFFWLEENAADFGFYNLPSEAWHWSTTGN